MEKRTIRALIWITSILSKYDIPYQIAGGFAAKIYGSPRHLNDIDIDIPDARFAELIDELSPYITFGPARFKDDKWDCEQITLNYHGQEIDICGADSCSIVSKDGSRTIMLTTDFAAAEKHTVDGLEVPVMPPRDLIAYKKELNGEHQPIDIAAVEAYLLSIGARG